MNWIFHITTATAWQAAQQNGVYHHASLNDEGFIHCSTCDQVAATGDRFFAGQTDLVLLWIERDRVTAPLKDEPASDHGVFPHIYGPLNLDAVRAVTPLVADATGHFPAPTTPNGFTM